MTEPRLPDGPVDLRLVAVDMDGTLLDADGRPPTALPEILRLLDDRGIVFAPASGRQYATLEALFGDVAAGMTFIAENGSYVVRDGVEVSSLVLDDDLVVRVVDLVRTLGDEGHDLGLVVCGKRSAWIERVDEAFLVEARRYYVELAVAEDLARVDDDVIKLALFDFGGTEAGVTADRIRLLPGDHRTIISSHHWVDVMHPEADKGAALERLQADLGVSRAQTAVFGDYLNDLGMIDAADLSFAMANAHPAVLDRARYLAPSNVDDGVTRTLRELLTRIG